MSWRYGGITDFKNFGIGAKQENFLYRLWLRADIGYDPSRDEPYELSQFGDVDFWRSHIFRQGYGDVRTFSRALLEFQFPPEHARKPRLRIAEIRELVKRLRRARTNLMFEVMDETQASRFIATEWEALAASDHR